MPPSQAPELDNRKDGDRRQCAICAEGRKHSVSADKLWHWSLENPGIPPFK